VAGEEVIHDLLHDNLSIWGLSLIEPGTIEQARRTARLPIVDGVALMPDAHFGKGATVGSVVVTRNAIIPAAVGVDIGCGMGAIRTNITQEQLPDDLSKFLHHLPQSIPAGVGVAKQGENVEGGRWVGENRYAFHAEMESKVWSNAAQQMGSLGSGNHFFEVDIDEHGLVWLVLHSGSRGLGNKVGSQYIKSTAEMHKLRGTVLEDRDLAWLREGDEDFNMYLGDMLLCQDYAAANRATMMHRVFKQFESFVGLNVGYTEWINCHHNFAQWESTKDGFRWVTRKGAIYAGSGVLGIIPGSMGDKTYIVQGLGNQESYCSCSHGAGRTLSRGAAKRELSQETFDSCMTGVTWQNEHRVSLLDEHPLAYKRIDDVMAAQSDLVRPIFTLKQILNYKGA
jgi:tRNA-splicing ligase RtcB